MKKEDIGYIFAKRYVKWLGVESYNFYQTYGLPQDMFLDKLLGSDIAIRNSILLYYRDCGVSDIDLVNINKSLKESNIESVKSLVGIILKYLN